MDFIFSLDPPQSFIHMLLIIITIILVYQTIFYSFKVIHISLIIIKRTIQFQCIFSLFI